MNNIARENAWLSKYAQNEHQLIGLAVWCWLDPIIIVDLTREEDADDQSISEAAAGI